jgi:uncharacterized damage-inducible protein DinB
MSELEKALTGNSAAAPPSSILEGLDETLAHREIPGVPRTIYAELWHIAFWQQTSLKWIAGVATTYPEHAYLGFPTDADVARESWERLCERFFTTLNQAAQFTHDAAKLEQMIRCPSASGQLERTMTVREQLESLAAHNAYHLGRIVLMRQILGAWPPPSGGDSW